MPKNYIPKKKELKSRKAVAAAEGSKGEGQEEEGEGEAAAPAAAAGAEAAAAGGSWAVPAEWQSVLWSRALQHGNLQVRMDVVFATLVRLVCKLILL